jgi:SAM-dependent methyltransferase
MGMWMSNIEQLSTLGYIAPNGSRILDIGSQNLYFATPEAIRRFVMRHGGISDEGAFQREAERIAYFSTPRPGERTAYISELFDLTPSIFYTSYDVCPALKTEIFDLNREACPPRYRGTFDVVLNFGTTEHIIDQVNCFRVMHDALRVGGVAVHQVPTIGWHGHGYVAYQPLFFDDLIRANGYEFIDRWYTRWQSSDLDAAIDIRDPWTPASRASGEAEAPRSVPNYNLNIILAKRVDAPFRISLELATSHAALAAEVGERYATGSVVAP